MQNPDRRELIKAAAVLAAAAPAHAAKDLQVGIADDALLTYAPSDQAADALAATWASQGIAVVRIVAAFGSVAPGATSTTIPELFDPGDPESPGYDWFGLDRAVRVVRAHGMGVILTVTGPVPYWATAQPNLQNSRYRPRPDRFAQFARAVALRFGPQVDRYEIWNEPNFPLWLQPQFTCIEGGRTCTPESPGIYRGLFNGAAPAIRGADPGAQILFGGLGPRGDNPRRANAVMRPLTFIRALGCVDDKLKAVRRGSCRGFRPISADGLGYHPHSRKNTPDQPNPQLDEAAVADLPRLEALLDAIQRRGGIRKSGRPGRLPLYFTEYGYQTSPPDVFDGVSLAKQAKLLQQANYVFWRDPRVRAVIQYEWRDEPLGRGTQKSTNLAASGWQSGLLFGDGRAKPALASFANPFWVDLPAGAKTATLWGQVRPGGRATVAVQQRVGGGGWTTVKKVATDAHGYFTLRRDVRRTSDFRYTWVDGGVLGVPGVRTSSVMRATPRKLPKVTRKQKR